MRGNWAMSRILGMALTQTAMSDPAAALALVREFGAEIERSAPADSNEGGSGRDGRRGGNRVGSRPSMVSSMIQSTLSEMRASNPDAASRFLIRLVKRKNPRGCIPTRRSPVSSVRASTPL